MNKWIEQKMNKNTADSDMTHIFFEKFLDRRTISLLIMSRWMFFGMD